MGLAGADLKRTENLKFWKLLGAGAGGGFSLKPDFSRYGLFAVWESQNAANDFFENSKFMKNYRRRAQEIWNVQLLPTKAHGKWSGVELFSEFAEPKPDFPVAVLTRATIRFSKLRPFWANVPATSAEIERATSLIASIGVGEAPFLRQATFSIWQTETAMQNFAYKNEVHREIIRRTRAENWYAEELFARFIPISSEGAWKGRDPLAGVFDE